MTVSTVIRRYVSQLYRDLQPTKYHEAAPCENCGRVVPAYEGFRSDGVFCDSKCRNQLAKAEDERL